MHFIFVFCWDDNYTAVDLDPVYVSLCIFFQDILFCAFFMCPKIFLFSLLQTFIRFLPVISSSSKENGSFFFFVIWLVVIKAPSLVPLSLANQERVWSNLLIFLDFIHSVVSFSLVCLSAYVVNNMKWEPRRILLLTRGTHDEHKKWCGIKDWDSVSLDAQTQCVSLLLVLFQLYWLSLTFPEWYAFLILFSLGLIPPWPSYSCLWWLLFFFFLLHFIYRMSVTVKIISRRIAETRSLTPDQATVARKTPFIKNKLWAGPGSFRRGACCWWCNKRSNCIHLHFSAKGSIREHLEWSVRCKYSLLRLILLVLQD